MVGRKQRQLGDRGEGVGSIDAGELAALPLGGSYQLEVLDDLAGIGAQPIVGVVSANEVLHLLGRSVCRGGAERGLGCSDTVARGKQRMSAGNHRFRLEVELAQELALPAVPGAGT